MVVERRLADVDRHHLGCWVCEGQHRCLIGAAPGNQDVQVGLVVAIRPEHPMGVAGIKPLPVVGQPTTEVEDWLRIHPALILARDDVGEGTRGHVGSVSSNARSLSGREQSFYPRAPPDKRSCRSLSAIKPTGRSRSPFKRWREAACGPLLAGPQSSCDIHSLSPARVPCRLIPWAG